jgi:hypothetical protein
MKLRFLLLSLVLLLEILLCSCKSFSEPVTAPKSDVEDRHLIRQMIEQVSGMSRGLKKPMVTHHKEEDPYCTIDFKNKTRETLRIYVEGPTYRYFILNPEQEENARLESGHYSIAVVFEKTQQLPGLSTTSLSPGKTYLMLLRETIPLEIR